MTSRKQCAKYVWRCWEADVNYKVAKDFVKNITEKAVGEEVLSSLTPAQQVIKIVRDELTELMVPLTAELIFPLRFQLSS